MDNQINYYSFGVYSLGFDFFKGMSGDKIIGFLQYFGWNKGYLIFPQPNEKTFRKKLREFFQEDLQKILYTQNLLDNIIVGKNIEKKCSIKGFLDDNIKNEPNRYFSTGQCHEMKWDDLLPILTPWFLQGLLLTFVDPYFNPSDKKWYEPLNKILERAVERKYYDPSEKNESTSNLHTEYHCVLPSSGNNLSYTKEDLEIKLKKMFQGCNNNVKVPDNCDLTIFIWRQWPYRHDRFIIIDVRDHLRKVKPFYISFTHGLDEKIGFQADITFHCSSDINKKMTPYNDDQLHNRIAVISKSSQNNWTFMPGDFLKAKNADLSAIICPSLSK